MNILLKKLKITNFKGIKSLQFDVSNVASIYGDNGTGKTTVFDAFLWLFFGKNSEGASQFEIKPLDEKTNFIEKVESEVEAIIHAGNQEISIRKVLRQKWTTRRGEVKESYSGDENVYFWNDVPLKEGEFKTKIKGLIDESLFRLITDPLYFNTMKWQDRRNILLQMAGNIDNQDVIAVASKECSFDQLLAALNSGKTIDEYKREIAAKKTKIKSEIEVLPHRIAEVRRNLPEALNFEALRKDKVSHEEAIKSVQAALTSQQEAQGQVNQENQLLLKEHSAKVTEHRQKVFDLRNRLQSIEFDLRTQAKSSGSEKKMQMESLKSQRNRLSGELGLAETKINNHAQSIQALVNQREDLYKKYDAIDSETFTFDETECVCPTCQRQLEADDISSKKDQLFANFNNSKSHRLAGIQTEGKSLNAQIEHLTGQQSEEDNKLNQLRTEISTIDEQISKLTPELESIQSEEDLLRSLITNHQEYTQIKVQIESLEKQGDPVQPNLKAVSDQSELHSKLSYHQAQLTEINQSLYREEEIKRGTERINELSTQEETLSQQLMELEGAEFSILQFTKAQVDLIEQRINGLFKDVRFKMFNRQVNGGESECCETLVNTNGSFVPFPSANNAGKINAGLDIINALCKYYDVSAPVFIDNRESVTQLAGTASQIVNLIVSEFDKKLRVA